MKQKEETGFAERLKSLREAKNMTQQELADAIGMGKSAVAKLEQGVTEPYWPTVLKIASALGVDCKAFCIGDGEAAKPASAPATRRGKK